MAAEKPAFVVVHGAWHVPAHYEPMAKPLREAGFEVIMRKNQSVDVKKDPGNMLQNDAAAVARVIEQTASRRKDIILLMHSYGGIAGCEAVGILNEAKPPTAGAGSIRRLVFLSAHALEKGQALLEAREIPGVEISEDGMTTHQSPYDRYYNEISREDAEPALALLQPMAKSAFYDKTTHTGWKDYNIPCTFIRCSQDTAVPLDLCDMYVKRMRDAGVEVDVETIEGGHCVHFTAPSNVVGVLEKIGNKVQPQ